MAQDKKQPTERTPQGAEVPIPKCGEFFGNLKKVAKVPPKGLAAGRPQEYLPSHSTIGTSPTDA